MGSVPGLPRRWADAVLAPSPTSMRRIALAGVVAVFIAAWRYRPDGTGRRRKDLVWLASAQPAGIVAQAALGGIVVLTKLDPVWVSVHFLLSMALVAAAVALQVRCTEGRGP